MNFVAAHNPLVNINENTAKIQAAAATGRSRFMGKPLKFLKNSAQLRWCAANAEEKEQGAEQAISKPEQDPRELSGTASEVELRRAPWHVLADRC